MVGLTDVCLDMAVLTQLVTLTVFRACYGGEDERVFCCNLHSKR
ncbi:hypothetical protein HMPREF9244_01299 [Alloscardovia omnicolens F0580]|uniref:Uncharacterized protein n=1 Tax=Alloscardovia omnicolens F0580 TaxID=1321816 RepID=U1R9I7_9BIFI|nr:hypothetical protein HMPREF9244_01299 [Alloscardovia omnicolens F0580]